MPIAFGCQVWLGGVNYFRNLLKATNAHWAGRFRIVLLTDKPDQFTDLDSSCITTVLCRMLDFRSGPIAIGSRILHHSPNATPHCSPVIRNHSPDVISHGHAGVQSLVPTLPWLPDLQHRALPHLFTPREHVDREALMKIYSRLWHLLLSSDAATETSNSTIHRCTHLQVHVLRFPAFGPLPVTT